MIIIDLDFLKGDFAKKLFKKEYGVIVKEFPGYPDENGFGSLAQYIVDSKENLTGYINFWSHGQTELQLWDIKKNNEKIETIFFDSYKEEKAQEKLREFILCLLPDYKFE